MFKKMSTKEYIEKASQIHNNLYDYSLTEYINNKTNILIICNIHGIFEQNPINHTHKKYGCPHCSKNKKETTNPTRIQVGLISVLSPKSAQTPSRTDLFFFI